MNLITELFKCIMSPTRGKWPALIILLVFGLLFLVGYERCTATFRINRLQKEADLLARLQEIQMHSTNYMSAELNQLQLVLITNATRTIYEKPVSFEFVPSKLSFSFDSLFKCFFGGSLWLVYAILFLPKSKTKEGKDQVKGAFIWAVATGVAGLFIPPIWWPWFHIFIFPWLFVFCIVIALAPFAILFTNYQVAKSRASANACINNLRRIDAAKQQWALESVKPQEALPTVDDLKRYLPHRAIPQCPNGGQYRINDVKSAPTCTEKGHCLV